MLASTTNNVYGIYDMSRGITEILAGNLTTSSSQATEESQYMTNPAKPPYVNLFRTADGFTKGAAQGAQNGNPLSWSNAQYEYRWNNDVCTWATCDRFDKWLYNISKYACGTNYQCLAVCQISRGGQNIWINHNHFARIFLAILREPILPKQWRERILEGMRIALQIRRIRLSITLALQKKRK